MAVEARISDRPVNAVRPHAVNPPLEAEANCPDAVKNAGSLCDEDIVDSRGRAAVAFNSVYRDAK